MLALCGSFALRRSRPNLSQVLLGLALNRTTAFPFVRNLYCRRPIASRRPAVAEGLGLSCSRQRNKYRLFVLGLYARRFQFPAETVQWQRGLRQPMASRSTGVPVHASVRGLSAGWRRRSTSARVRPLRRSIATGHRPWRLLAPIRPQLCNDPRAMPVAHTKPNKFGKSQPTRGKREIAPKPSQNVGTPNRRQFPMVLEIERQPPGDCKGNPRFP